MIRRTRVALLGLMLATIIVGPAYADTGARLGSTEESGSVASQALTISPMFIEDADLTEGFEAVVTLEESGWSLVNMSEPLGSTSWYQGNAGVFNAHAGESTEYIGANFNNASGSGTISNWLILPVRELRNGDEFAFWTRAPASGSFADRLQVRLSTSGNSADVGDSAESVGDFTVLLHTINPDLLAAGYPQEWQRYSFYVSDLPEGTTTEGRFALRYYVTDAGPGGSNSDYIGIDTVSYLSYTPEILAETTVSTDGTCGATNSVEADPSGNFWVCNRLTNQGNVPLTQASFVGPYPELVGDLDTADGGPIANIPVGGTASWLFGPFPASQRVELTTQWQAGNPERGADPLTAVSSMEIMHAEGAVDAFSTVANDVVADAGADDVTLMGLRFERSGEVNTSLYSLQFTATNLSVVGRPAGSVTIGDVIESFVLRDSAGDVPATTVVDGNTVTFTFTAPVPVGASYPVSLVANARSSVAGLAVVSAFAAVGLFGLGIRTRSRRVRVGALMLAVVLTVAACGGGQVAPQARFSMQLTNVDSNSVPNQDLPLDGPAVRINY